MNKKLLQTYTIMALLGLIVASSVNKHFLSFFQLPSKDISAVDLWGMVFLIIGILLALSFLCKYCFPSYVKEKNINHEKKRKY